MRSAPVILFPTWRYLPIMEATKKPTFPSYFSYHYIRSRYLQFILAAYLNIPRLKAKTYAGRQKGNIPQDFSYPLAIWPVRKSIVSPRIVSTAKELENVCRDHHFVIVREIPHSVETSIAAVVVVGFRIVGWTPSISSWMDAEYLFELSRNICLKVNIDCASVQWVKTGGSWKFDCISFPPASFLCEDGQVILRNNFLCSFITDIAIEWEQPPWQKIDQATCAPPHPEAFR